MKYDRGWRCNSPCQNLGHSDCRPVLCVYLARLRKLMRPPVFGDCHICGAHTKLSFEHNPPEKAFNDNAILADVQKLRSGCHPDLYEEGGRKNQRGLGKFTLCESCNNKTGHWYGTAYVKFAKQGMGYLQASRYASSFLLSFRIHPLRLIKQIMCMFMSANGPKFQGAQQDLVRFVLNPDIRHLPSHLRLFAFYSIGDRSRSSGVSGVLKGYGTESPENYVFSEFTFPPFGYVLTFNCPAPDSRLVDISYLADDFAYKEERTIWLRLPVLPIFTFYPTDYRNRDQVLKDAEQNLADL